VSDPIAAALTRDLPRITQRLVDYVRIPSVSTDPAFAEGIRAAQDYLIGWLGSAGFAGARHLASQGHAPVYAEWLGEPGALTILVYGHYDVQPPAPLDKWLSPPFEPQIRDGRLYARGASDDKGPVVVAIEALAAFLRLEHRLPVNVKILIEGEEEVGSMHLAQVVRAHRDLLAADVVISADGARWRADLPTVTVGARGMTGFEFVVTTAAKDLHSGRYGGIVANALHVVAELIASLRRRDGRIAVSGFYDGIADPEAAERAALAQLPFDEPQFFAPLGAMPAGEAGFTTLERLFLRPTLEVNGLWGGYTGPGTKTVIPHEAHAKLTARLVPGQAPQRVKAAIMAHLERCCPAGARLTFIETRGSTAAYLIPPLHPALAIAERVIGELAGRPALRVRMGATLPINQIFSEELGIDTIPFSFATSDEDYHAPNEFFRLSALEEGLVAWTRLLRSLASEDTAAYRPFRRPTAAPKRG
jgi:acetylornithine deacetylase/succinyl-diaminopimelate desuccinylase-like protein